MRVQPKEGNLTPDPFPKREGEFGCGIVYTNSIESFSSVFKRGVMGRYHKVNRNYLPLYLAEFQFQFNHRHEPNIFGKAIAGC